MKRNRFWIDPDDQWLPVANMNQVQVYQGLYRNLLFILELLFESNWRESESDILRSTHYFFIIAN